MAAEKTNGHPFVSRGHGHREDVVVPDEEPKRAPHLPARGLVPCDGCGTPALSRGDHFSVHFASNSAMRPCPRSWPPKVSAK